jgi:pimeloyl-ACP methyl ester carboxylesterase
MEGFPMPYIKVGKEKSGGIEIYYKDRGKDQPLIFSHGWPLTADAWEDQMLFLASHGYRRITYDRRGHVMVLSSVLAKLGKSMGAAIDSAVELGGADTTDLFMEVSRGVDKLLWKVEAPLQAKDWGRRL